MGQQQCHCNKGGEVLPPSIRPGDFFGDLDLTSSCLITDEFQDSLPSAHTEEPVHYEGSMIGSLKDGEGVLKLPDGAWYEGQFVKDRKCGKGVYHYPTGSKYTGQWHDDLQEGQGREVWADGSTFEGDFRQGEKHGRGRFRWVAGLDFGLQVESRLKFRQSCEEAGESAAVLCGWHMRVKAEFLELVTELQSNASEAPATACLIVWARTSLCMHGLPGQATDMVTSMLICHMRCSARCDWKLSKIEANGCSYEGQFDKNDMNGIGEYIFSDGRGYSGEWVRNNMGPSGKMWWPDGRVYEGQFSEGRKDGHGRLDWPDGRSYNGQWHEGKQHGRATATTAKGVTRQSCWCHGQFQEWVEEASTDMPMPSRPALASSLESAAEWPAAPSAPAVSSQSLAASGGLQVEQHEKQRDQTNAPGGQSFASSSSSQLPRPAEAGTSSQQQQQQQQQQQRPTSGTAQIPGPGDMSEADCGAGIFREREVVDQRRPAATGTGTGGALPEEGEAVDTGRDREDGVREGGVRKCSTEEAEPSAEGGQAKE
ncbi:unnamed protein product [Polarella glacialis]|uniref:MORN repeat-containing protein 5 n=1 Tax=Polarella glacialis TaxID=89957 RepID=A0A813FUJ2_POLGL|nr:unnamed protein product [Polarella glacialis]